jgi:FkbM family methyltransferase
LIARTILDFATAALHHAPFKSGLSRLSFNPVINRLIKSIPGTVKARLRDGKFIEVSTDDYHGRVLYLFGTNDPKVEQTARTLLKPGDVFLDIGANYSTIGLSASHAVGPTGAIHLFEPQELLCNRVQDTIRAGGYKNVVLHRVGLMDRDATLTLQSPAHHSGMATFADTNGNNYFERTETCEVREISKYVGPLVYGKPFGAKLDIEGSEMAIMPWLLAQPNLKFLIFEAAHNQRELYDVIKSAGLVLFGLKRHPLLLRAIRVDDFSEMGDFHDLLAIRWKEQTPPSKAAHPKSFA